MPPAAPRLAGVLRRPFAGQVAFFRGKLGNLVPTATWRDIGDGQNEKPQTLRRLRPVWRCMVGIAALRANDSFPV